MERTDFRLGARRDYVDLVRLEDKFFEKIIEHWMEGKVPHDMVHISDQDEYVKIFYGFA